MMFFQDPSLLEFQQALQDATNNNNLKTIFSVDSIPKESQIRTILDIHPYDPLLDVFSDLGVATLGRHVTYYLISK